VILQTALNRSEETPKKKPYIHKINKLWEIVIKLSIFCVILIYMRGGLIVERIYMILFLVGVIYAVVTFLLGGFLDIVHLGTHIDTHVDGHIDCSGATHTLTVSPLKPIVIVSFITVFGGVGTVGSHYKVSPLPLFAISFIAAYLTAFVLYRFVMIPLYKAQNTSAVSQEELVGLYATVISSIMESGFGTISYVVNGSIYNAPAQHVNKEFIPQGEEVKIVEIKNNVFYVEPLNHEGWLKDK
jgi:membrane protein implicated in regulation of membrane protease activity